MSSAIKATIVQPSGQAAVPRRAPEECFTFHLGKFGICNGDTLHVTPTSDSSRTLAASQTGKWRSHTLEDMWRRGGDSNPGHPFGVKLISSQPCSATPAPLREKLSRPDFVCRGLPRISISSSRRAPPSERRILRSRRAVFSCRVKLPALVCIKAAIAEVSWPRLQNITANRAIVAGQRWRVLNLIAFALRELQRISCRIPQRLQRIGERSPRLRRRIRHQCRVQSIQRSDYAHIRFARSVAMLRGHHVPQKSP